MTDNVSRMLVACSEYRAIVSCASFNFASKSATMSGRGSENSSGSIASASLPGLDELEENDEFSA